MPLMLLQDIFKIQNKLINVVSVVLQPALNKSYFKIEAITLLYSLSATQGKEQETQKSQKKLLQNLIFFQIWASKLQKE